MTLDFSLAFFQQREVITQRQLRHPNILQLLGVFAMSNSQIAIVAPWAPGGDAVAFVEKHTGPDCFMHLVGDNT